MAKLEIIIDGKKLQFFDDYKSTSQIDSIAGNISFSTYFDIETFGYKNVKVLRNDVLVFTGEVVEKLIPNSIPPKPFIYKAESLPHILNESTLPVEAYPMQLEGSTLKDIVEYICSYFEITALFDQSASKEAATLYKESNIDLAKVAGQIINDLITQEGVILTHDADSNLVITKKIEQSEIVLPRFTSNNKSYDLRKFFNSYVALGQAPIGEDADIQAIAKYDNIDSRRITTKIQDSGGIDTIENKAIGMRADSLKSIKEGLTFNNFYCNVGDFITVGTEKLIINQIDYSFSSKGEVSSIGVIDSNVYNR